MFKVFPTSAVRFPITVEIYDKDNIKLDEKSKTVIVEKEWIAEVQK
ncbi:MAG: hypothetical protein ISS13_04460 [Actinobacteria bacterium]|nr:hypothetical protein [Actinomycetota bacterium]